MDLEYHRVGDYVEARASGTAREIASLVLELQGKPKMTISVSPPKAQTPEERERLATMSPSGPSSPDWPTRKSGCSSRSG